MLEWLRKKKEAPLTGAPAVRRQKTPSAESGYVYQYFYEGQRAANRDGVQGVQYVFNVSADRKSSFPVSVFVGEDALESWQTGTPGRSSPTSVTRWRNGALQAFDQRGDPAAMNEETGPASESTRSWPRSISAS